MDDVRVRSVTRPGASCERGFISIWVRSSRGYSEERARNRPHGRREAAVWAIMQRRPTERRVRRKRDWLGLKLDGMAAVGPSASSKSRSAVSSIIAGHASPADLASFRCSRAVCLPPSRTALFPSCYFPLVSRRRYWTHLKKATPSRPLAAQTCNDLPSVKVDK